MKKVFIYFLPLLFSTCSTDADKNDVIPVDFCSSIHFSSPEGLSAKLKSVSEKMKTQTGVYTLEDGDGAMVARAWLCENSEKTIDIQYFIFSS